MKKFTYLKLALAALFLFIGISASFGDIHYGILPTNADEQDAIEAWDQFKSQGLTSQHTADPSSMLRQFFGSDTRGEYQAWSLIMAVMFDDLETAEKLWNFCKYYIPRQNYGMVPWIIYQNYNNYGGQSVGDADFDYCIALDMAARKWPNWVGDDGHDWDYWAKYYMNQIYDIKRSVVDDPSSINALSGKKAGDVDEHYYLHYSPYGYLNNWRDRTGQKNWTEEVNGLESVYDAEINLQKITLAKYYGTSQNNRYCWPPHQVRKNGYAADDLTKKYDSGWNMMNWGPSRITLRACHAYINNGDAHGAKMMRFMADRWLEETGGDPANLRKGYSLGSCSGWGEPTAWMIGGAAVVSMVDEEYRPMLDNMYDALVNLNVSGDRHAQLAKAYYLMHLTGLMDFAIGSCQSVTGVSITNAPSQMDLNDELRLTVDFQPSNVCNRGLQWSSSNSDVATVDQSGNIHAIATGTVTITVTSDDGGYSDEATIDISGTIVPPSSISIDQSSVSLSPTETIHLNATVLPEDVTYSGVTWTSSNEDVATVDVTGLVTAISGGNATITATTEDGSLSDICDVNVSNALVIEAEDYISSTNATTKNILGTECILFFSSSPSSVTYSVNVSEPGEYDIQAVTYSQYSTNSINVEVNGQSQETLTVPQSEDFVMTTNSISISLVQGANEIILSESGGNFYVDQFFLYGGGNGIIDVTGVTVSPDLVTLYPGDDQQLNAVVEPADATNKSVTWSSSNESIATVNSSGIITAVSTGSAIITVTTNDGDFTDIADINVIPVQELTYSLNVENGSGDGNYEEGESIEISADSPESGYTFSGWTGDTQYITDTGAETTTVTMPAADISVSASYSLIDNPGGELTIVDVDASGSTYVWFPNLAIDDNIETFWRKKKDNSQWLEVTLSADTDINEVQLSLFDNTSIWPIKIFVNSTEVFNGNSITSANDDLQSYSFSPVNGQTVRVQLNAGSSTDNFGIREIKVIGAGTVINNYLLSVIDGSGSGTYQPSQIISISADAPATGYVFSEWTGDVQYLTDASAQNTTVTMPAADISVSASYAPEEPVSDNITLQAEDADELARANIESTFSDFNGTGYVYLRGTGDWGRIVWNNIELSPGTYSVQVRSQANGSDNASLFVNDTEYALPLPDASDWTYTTVSDITFNATNTLKINNGKQQNIDELIIAVSGNLKKGQILNSSNSSELQSIRVYPNPVSGGTLYLTDYADIKLVNMQGKVLLEKHHVNSVDVSDLQQGIYLLSIGTTFRKIVIE